MLPSYTIAAIGQKDVSSKRHSVYNYRESIPIKENVLLLLVPDHGYVAKRLAGIFSPLDLNVFLGEAE